jgi:catechol 2,3-dioxygenase-like lactoylglutathione lyase family enzyme
MWQARFLLVLFAGFGLGALADWTYRWMRAPKGPLARMAHVGILVPDLDRAIGKWRSMGFHDIEVTPPGATEAYYRGERIECVLRKAWVRDTIPQIELTQPASDTPNPWSGELHERGEVLHHIAYRVADEAEAVRRFRQLGMVEIAHGQWAQDGVRSTWEYVKAPDSGLIVEFISQSPRA